MLIRNALLDFRMWVKDDSRFSTYYAPGDAHAWLQGCGFYTTTIGGVRMADWFRNVLEAEPAGHVDP